MIEPRPERSAAPWIEWPVRIIALAVVVPLRVAWEFLVLSGRFLHRYVVAPVGWFLDRVIWRPLVWFAVNVIWRPAVWVAVQVVWRPLVWVAVNVVWRPLTWAAVHLVWQPLCWAAVHLVWQPLTWAAVHLIWRPLTWAARYLVWRPLRWTIINLVLWPLVWIAVRVVRPAVVAVARFVSWLLTRTGRGVWPVLALLGRASRFVGGLLVAYVLRPLGWLVRHLVLLPVKWLFVGLWWLIKGLGRVLVIVVVAFGRGVAAGWRWTGRALAAVGRAIAALGRGLGWLAAAVWRSALRPVVAFVGRILLLLGKIVIGAFVGAWWLVGVLGRFVYRYALRPVGLGVAWAWRHSAVPLWRAVVWAWRHTVVPVARGVAAAAAASWRWSRESVFQPAARTARSVRAAVRSAFGRS
ncbi:hypothetical protein [Luedemannella helvata]|uniref:hypothetical protein n=1 Tax=Luedemannella helvata TaxID=349315 RepID=UPI0031E2B694